MNFERFGGRTFLLTIGCGVVTSLMRVFERLDNPTYGTIITGSVCAYIAANAVEKHASIKADASKANVSTVATAATTIADDATREAP